ncbi:MAG: hypothetical protein WEB60_01515 [Terrimicrobiaceae bacterium]
MNEIQKAGMSVFLAAVLFVMAALFYFGGEGGIFSYVAIVPGLLGILLTYNIFHSLLASKTPPTTIVLAPEPLIRGQPATLTVRQYGPASLQRLRVNFTCEKSVRKNKSRDLTYPHQMEVFDSGPCEVPLLDVAEFQTTFAIPGDSEPTMDTVETRIVWRVEIWGRVIGRADFQRTYTVVVT